MQALSKGRFGEKCEMGTGRIYATREEEKENKLSVSYLLVIRSIQLTGKRTRMNVTSNRLFRLRK